MDDTNKWLQNQYQQMWNDSNLWISMAAKSVFGGPNFTRRQRGGGCTWGSGTMDRLGVAIGGHRGNGANELGCKFFRENVIGSI